jgi:CRP-like cAMP-binding protein
VSPHAPKSNLILAGLSAAEYDCLKPHLESISLRTGEVLAEMGTRVEYVYFPQTGVISIVRPAEDGTYIETATVGREGLAGIAILFGGEWSPARLEVQVPGLFCRAPANAFRALLDELPVLRALAGKYVLSYLDQTSQSIVCNSRHSLARRCARWLLMAHDRVASDSFELTHKTLARMLDVRRPGVTEALVALKRKKLIDYRHGIIEVRDRAGLEAAACPCHGINRAHLTLLYEKFADSAASPL